MGNATTDLKGRTRKEVAEICKSAAERQKELLLESIENKSIRSYVDENNYLVLFLEKEKLEKKDQKTFDTIGEIQTQRWDNPSIMAGDTRSSGVEDFENLEWKTGIKLTGLQAFLTRKCKEQDFDFTSKFLNNMDVNPLSFRVKVAMEDFREKKAKPAKRRMF